MYVRTARSRAPWLRRCFSTRSSLRDYASTIPNLKIGSETRVIYQGFTGKQATVNAQQSLEWGTKIVGGVTPGRDGEHLGLPVLQSVRAAKEQLNPDATAIFVAAKHAAGAIEEAISAEIPLVVAVAEHIPVHDMLRISEMLRTQSKSRLVGANSPGIISAIGRCRIGFQPLPVYQPGHIGVIAKSGTLSYETVASLTRAKLGQSICVGVGGDVIAGTSFVEALSMFEHDEDTHAIVLVGEIGGTAEEEAAAWITDYRRRVAKPKPIAALVAGACAQPGRVMGHAGAWIGPGELSAREKYETLERAGVTMVDHPSKFGVTMHMLTSGLGKGSDSVRGAATLNSQQTRGFHSMRKPRPLPALSNYHVQQRRKLHLSQNAISNLFEMHQLPSTREPPPEDAYKLTLTIDRSARVPILLAAQSSHKTPTRIPLAYGPASGPTHDFVSNHLPEALDALGLSSGPSFMQVEIAGLLKALNGIFHKTEALVLETSFTISESGDLKLWSPTFMIDDAAFRTAGRVADIHNDITAHSTPPDPREVTAGKDGIVYIPLVSIPSSSPASGSETIDITEPGSIATLVNGAGLAMNTLDSLLALPSLVFNFLDTGGKATSATIKTCFELLLQEPSVRVVLVNIFGGLTRCDMIAEGILKAYEELGEQIERKGVKVVVRLRGTNEKEGQEIVAKSGLPIKAFDGFEDAAQEVVRLSEIAALEGRREERLKKGE